MKRYNEVKDKYESSMRILSKKYKAFYAFNNSQLEDGMEDGTTTEEYTSITGGLVIKKAHVEDYMSSFMEIMKGYDLDMINAYTDDEGIFDKNPLIDQAIDNYEVCISGDITQVLSELEDFGITKEDILKRCSQKRIWVS